MAAETVQGGRLRGRVAAGIEAFLAAVFPPRCLQCRRLLPAADRGVIGLDTAEEAPLRLRRFFCSGCLSAVIPVEPPFCPRCGLMFKGRAGENHLCSRCLEQAPPFHMARTAFAYDRSLVAVIHCFKYKAKTRLAGPLGMLLWNTFRRHWEGEAVDVILPVPLHRHRLRRRGFNQSDLLLREWGKRPHLQRLPPVASGALRRTKATLPQAGLGRRERESNIRGAFVVRRPDQVSGRHVVLVDDVITTGATAGECARVLLASGARRVDVLALARVI